MVEGFCSGLSRLASEVPVKTIGLLGGMSWESTVPYYRLINQEVSSRLGKLHSAELLLYSVDFQPIEELQHANARNMATGFASRKGVGDARINGSLIGPYPINSKGQALDQVKDENGAALPAQHPLMQPKAYRVDIPVCRRLV